MASIEHDHRPLLNRPVRPVGGPSRPELLRDLDGGKPSGTSFRDLLGKSLKEVNSTQQDAEKAVEALLTGQTDNLSEVMIAVEKADLAFRTLMQMRNKLVEAYEEVSRMRI
jgi:flagellar hook-basal body complex protein FliE